MGGAERGRESRERDGGKTQGERERTGRQSQGGKPRGGRNREEEDQEDE